MNEIRKTPTEISQVVTADDNVNWTNLEAIKRPDGYALTDKELYYISGVTNVSYRNSAAQVWVTDFKFENLGTILGIEVQLVTQRLSRIQDKLISLCYQGQIIGDNKFNLKAENDQTYGGNNDLWGRSWTVEEIQDPSFGVVIELQPHLNYPHSELGLIDFIAIKIYHDS
jgi:hypothetical protein